MAYEQICEDLQTGVKVLESPFSHINYPKVFSACVSAFA